MFTALAQYFVDALAASTALSLFEYKASLGFLQTWYYKVLDLWNQSWVDLEVQQAVQRASVFTVFKAEKSIALKGKQALLFGNIMC